MKSLWTLALTVLFISLLMFSATATDTNFIYAEAVEIAPGKKISIPIRIKNNTGIMGFKITVDYPKEIFEDIEVTRGAVTSKGMFEDSISSTDEGVFDVIWSDTSDNKTDGTIFILMGLITEEVQERDYQINLTYSQPDTFNEKWEDVVLRTSNIPLILTEDVSQKIDEASTAADENKTETITSTAGISTEIDDSSSSGFADEVLQKVDSDFLQKTIEDAIEDVGADSIDKMSDVQFKDFELSIKASMADYGATINSAAKGKADYEVIYHQSVKEAFIDSVSASVDSKVIVAVIDDALKSYDVNDVSQLTDEQAKEFADSVLQGLKGKGADFELGIYEEVDKTEIIDNLYNELKRKEKSNDKDKMIILLIVSVCVYVFVVLLLVAVFKKKKHKKEKI